ncbi:hypothetical protein [Enterobacter roggenkampii]|uniref:hypothetical protein n=1 Tax=Enterobacter roggenkampii TaxID=1812935 RepID=UPI002FF55F42
MSYFLDTWLYRQIECLLSHYGLQYQGDTPLIRFSEGPIKNQIEIFSGSDEVEVILIQSIPCKNSDIALRLSQCVTPESNFGVVGAVFFLDNKLNIATSLPTDLTAEEWLTIFECHKALLVSFLGK